MDQHTTGTNLIPLEGFLAMRQLQDGRVIGVMPMIFTTGLVVGITPETIGYRYCYETSREALAAFRSWDGQGDPPGEWIKLKGHPTRGDAHGPGYRGFVERQAP